MLLSIVIPTLDAAGSLGPTLAAINGEGGGFEIEIIITDGGSNDAIRDVARAAGARVITAAGGRGPQLCAGAAEAKGAWLMFLHADTRLALGWRAHVAAFIGDPENRERAATFRFALDDDGAPARRLERMVAWRFRALGLAYGDQGLIIGQEFYSRLGGFAPLVLMEDVDMARRIGRKRLVMLDCKAVTSAARYREGGYLLRPARNIFCLGLYFLGVPVGIIARIYR
ncbi:MAG: TIGR04283 family arsenosugar biosynthesis glycosyltransferase [Alphaproteobacteria bacterium]